MCHRAPNHIWFLLLLAHGSAVTLTARQHCAMLLYWLFTTFIFIFGECKPKSIWYHSWRRNRVIRRSVFPDVPDLVSAGRHELRLLEKLRNELSNYNRYERPAEDDNDALKVELGLTLQQIIDVVSGRV